MGNQWMEGEVEARKGNVNYAIRLTGSKNIVHRHIDQLRTRYGKTQIAESSEIDVDIDIPVSTTPTVEEATLRRSNRVIKKPARLGDFVSK